MGKKPILIIIVVVLLIGLGVGGYFGWKKYKEYKDLKLQEETLKKAGEAADIIKDSAAKGVLPSMNITSNPMENEPVINPVEKANPYKNIKTNPFE